MIKTYNDLILACDNFGYSKEYYEMMKEAAEIDLMNIYVANQEYMAENAEMIQESADVLEDYFQEAAGLENVKNVAKTAASKTANLAKKIWAKIKQILKAIGNFFQKFKMHTKQRMERLMLFNDLMKYFSAPDRDLDALEAVWDKYDKAIRGLGIGMPLTGSEGEKYTSTITGIVDYMVFLLRKKSIQIRLKGNRKVAEPSDLAKLMKYIMTDAKKADALIKKIEDKDSITVPLFDDKIDSLKATIDRIIAEIDSAVQKDAAVLGSDEIEDVKSAATKRINQLNIAMGMASATLSAYSDVDKMLSIMADGAVALKRYFEEVKAWGKKEKAEAKEDKKLAKEEAKYYKKQAKQQAKEDNE